MIPWDTERPRTAVYIDGYNLYYGRLRGTSFKWLDVVALFRSILSQRDQNEQLVFVRMFTAPALATFASHGRSSVLAQSAYHRALKEKYGELVSITYGTHTFNKMGVAMPRFVHGQAFDRTDRVRVWKIEEKKTDVNLAMSMYRDVFKGVCNRVLLVSNDSDIEPALAAIREDFPRTVIGVAMPVREADSGTIIHRPGSRPLSEIADWTIRGFTDDQLLQAQLPPLVPTKKKPILKPAHW